MKIKELKNKEEDISLLTIPRKVNKERQTSIPCYRDDKNMNDNKLWIWEEKDDDLLWPSNDDLTYDIETDYNPTTVHSDDLFHDILLPVSEIPSPTLVFQNLVKTLFKAFEKMSLIISFDSGSNSKRKRFELYIERYDLRVDSSSITSRYNPRLGPPYLKPFNLSKENFTKKDFNNNYVDFGKSKNSISSIDSKRVFPPIGPPLV
jgi:hypothetical protein